MKKLICLVGETARGKDTVARYLQKHYNMKAVVSHTTRPKRDTDIEGVTSEIKAYSKINNSISSPNINHEYSYNLGSNNRIFETVDVNSQNIVNGPKAFNRCIDTESKILEDIAHQLGYNTFAVDESVVGNVYLITERAPCPSCESVIAQFKEMFPNVNVEVKYMY